MTKLYMKGIDCKCVPNYGTMKDTMLFLAHGFYMVYCCPHVTMGSDKE